MSKAVGLEGQSQARELSHVATSCQKYASVVSSNVDLMALTKL